MSNLVNSLKSAISNVKKPYKKIIFACIGTDRSTGDSYGPIVGTMLKKRGYEVYGTLKSPMHAQNLEFVLKNIDMKNNLVIAIDASLGEQEDIGKIKIKNKSVRPGAGVNKNLPKCGDIGIIGIVNKDFGSSNCNFLKLQNTSLGGVVDLAENTVNIICRAVNNVPDNVEEFILEK
jgi:putative sporulation protein YyaC